MAISSTFNFKILVQSSYRRSCPGSPLTWRSRYFRPFLNQSRILNELGGDNPRQFVIAFFVTIVVGASHDEVLAQIVSINSDCTSVDVTALSRRRLQRDSVIS